MAGAVEYAGRVGAGDAGGVDYEVARRYVMLFGILFIVAGICNITRMGGDVGSGVMLIVMGAMIFYTFADARFGKYKIDFSVKNKIVAEDGNGRYLVEAKTSRQITGPRPHTQDNLPAHLIRVRKGLWIVDRNTAVMQPGEEQKIKWEPVTSNKSIEPRGNGHSGGFLNDVMNGYEHNYIKGDDHE